MGDPGEGQKILIEAPPPRSIVTLTSRTVSGTRPAVDPGSRPEPTALCISLPDPPSGQPRVSAPTDIGRAVEGARSVLSLLMGKFALSKGVR